METKLESSHDWFEDLSSHNRLFGVSEDGAISLQWGSSLSFGDWSSFDTGPELLAVENDDYSGCTHHWAFAEPVTTPWEAHGLDFTRAVTVYSQHYVYCGPEEGGWGVWKKSPLAVFLVDISLGHEEAAAVQRAQVAAEKWVAGNDYHEDDVFVIAESFPLARTSVGHHYYC